jgi:hypothetical protein
MKSTVGNEETDRIDAIVRENEEEMYRTFPIDERDFFAVSDRPEAGGRPGGRT